MKNYWYWIIGIGLVLILGLLFLLGLGIFGQRGSAMTWMTGGSDVWRNSWNHHGIRWGAPMMGLFGGLLLWLFLIGLVALTVVGIVLLVRALQSPNRDRIDHPQHVCDHCGKKVDADWQVCPYCGEPLKAK